MQINEIILVVFKLLNCGAIINCKLLIKATVERINNNHAGWKVLLLNTTVKKNPYKSVAQALRGTKKVQRKPLVGQHYTIQKFKTSCFLFVLVLNSHLIRY